MNKASRMVTQSLNSVLVVDDDPILCEFAKSFFGKSGATQIAVAHNGKDALEIVEKHGGPLDFILLDLKMPVMDGIQFLRHMHKRSYQGVIGILSGEGAAILSLAMDLAKKHGLNVVGPITKPLNAACLDALISKREDVQSPIYGSESRAFTASELEAALERQQIIAHYQPQIDAASGDITGVEALARWCHPELGIVMPDRFIPLAEDSGLMPMLTDQMIKNVIRDVKILDRYSQGLTVSINLDAAVLNDTKFPDAVALMIDRSGHKRSRFILELTESKLVEDSANSMEVLARLDLAGFELSLDDFGTQHSNLEQLNKFPFKEIKIDRSFVCSAATDDRSKAMVESCVSLGRQLGLRIVAEGVETDEDWNYLASLGVDILQGYRFAKPMPIDEFESWLTSHQIEVDQNEFTTCN